MINLIKIELRKILPYKTFWILIGLYFLLMAMVISGIESFLHKIGGTSMIANSAVGNLSLYTFPSIWHNIIFVADFFKIFLAIIMIILMTNEFEFRTIRMHIINGQSKFEFLLGKLGIVLLISIITSLFVFVIGLILGYSNTDVSVPGMVTEKIIFIPTYFISVITYMTFAIFISVLFKRSGLAIGLLLLYTFIIESIIGYILPGNIGEYLPMNVLDNLITFPLYTSVTGLESSGSGIGLIMCVVYTLLFSGLSWIILKKSDI